MSLTRINAAHNALQEIASQVIGSQAILLLELEAQGWKKDKQFAGGMCQPERGLYLTDKDLLSKLTNDSTDCNYIHLVTHLLRNGWTVINNRGDVAHPENHGDAMPVREALIASITVAAGN